MGQLNIGRAEHVMVDTLHLYLLKNWPTRSKTPQIYRLAKVPVY
ncbi:hypothetical protein EV281_11073 [Rhizobium sp. BK418]|nr:hypothetical protein EV281_11073 [Rhizobium sp. BK418]